MYLFNKYVYLCCNGRIKFMQSNNVSMTYFKMVQHDSSTEYIIIYPDQVGELGVQDQPHSFPPDRHILVLQTQTQIFINVISHLKEVPHTSSEYLLITLLNKNCPILNIYQYIYVGHMSLLVITTANCYFSVSIYTLLYDK